MTELDLELERLKICHYPTEIIYILSQPVPFLEYDFFDLIWHLDLYVTVSHSVTVTVNSVTVWYECCCYFAIFSETIWKYICSLLLL